MTASKAPATRKPEFQARCETDVGLPSQIVPAYAGLGNIMETNGGKPLKVNKNSRGN
jgi:hypothetical protein